MLARRYWKGYRLGYVAPEPLWVSLVKYRAAKDRRSASPDEANLVSSHLEGSNLHAPIIDIDFPHRYVPSTTEDHAHLYLDVPIPRWRLAVLLVGLRVGRVTEVGFTWWSLRRGGTFVRPRGVSKP
jgi:hypothetical protein